MSAPPPEAGRAAGGRSVDRRLAALESRLARLERRLAALGGERVDAGAGGPVLPGTAIRCTAEVLDRLRRVALPSVRQVVIERVADLARARRVAVVDTAFFDRAATF